MKMGILLLSNFLVPPKIVAYFSKLVNFPPPKILVAHSTRGSSQETAARSQLIHIGYDDHGHKQIYMEVSY